MAEKNERKPWPVKSWCMGQPSAQDVAKMEDVLDVYQRAYDPKWPVVCLDAISQALRDTPRASLPTQPGQPQRPDSEYRRPGVCKLFLARQPLRGECG